MNFTNELYKNVLQNYTNHDIKLVYSDYLEEQGQIKEAEAWRWLGTNHKYPVKGNNSYEIYYWMNDTPKFHYVLPNYYFQLLKFENKNIWCSVAKSYYDLHIAFADFVEVFKEFPNFAVNYHITKN